VAGRLEDYMILLGVTGGIAAYKAAQLCSDLTKEAAAVTVVMTAHARQFVGSLTFSTLSDRQVFGDLFEAENVYNTRHISLAGQADLIVVAPATANIIGKMAGGICDDLLSTLLAAADSEILLAPAMNHRMWQNPAVKRNVETLKQWGRHFVGPATGRLACGDEDIGRMSEPDEILERAVELLAGRKPKKKTN
jgi:phosphopantothenoylcysteine synthetase/decarboxylase